MVVVKSRHDGWEWFFGEDTWQGEGRLAEEMRDWPEYDTAKDIIRLWIQRFDKQQEQANERKQRSTSTGE